MEPQRDGFWKRNKNTIINITIFVIVIIILSIVIPQPSITFQKSNVPYKIRYRGAILSNYYECANIGRSLIRKGADATDALIGSQICDGVLNAQHLRSVRNINFLMNIYTRKTRQATIINSKNIRSEAETNFEENTRSAVPDVFKELWTAHQNYGKLPWATLVEPTIQLCKKGHSITRNLEKVFRENEQFILQSPLLRKELINPLTNHTYSHGSRLKQIKLAESLDVSAKTKQEKVNSTTRSRKYSNNMRPISAKIFNNLTLHTVGAPGSGAILVFILNVLNKLLDKSVYYDSNYWQQLTEVFKFAYAKRAEMDGAASLSEIQELIDNLISDEFANEIIMKIRDDYTSSDPKYYGIDKPIRDEDNDIRSVVVLAPGGDATVISYVLNKKFVKESDDQITNRTSNLKSSSPPRNGPQVISSMCPTIIVDNKGDVMLAIGSSGSGFNIITSVVQVILRKLWFMQNLHDAIHDPRIHQEFFPMKLKFEENFDEGIIMELIQIGHKTDLTPTVTSAVSAVSQRYNVAEYYYDRRSEGGEVLLE